MQTIVTNDWVKYFPHPHIRPLQEEAINYILNAYINLNKKYVICELPTGIGKSAVAITLAKYFEENVYSPGQKSTWLLTTQKILQQQYKEEFQWLANVWSKTNYECVKKVGVSCQLGSWINKIFKGTYCECIYTKDRNAFLESEVSITNIQFFLNHAEYASANIQNRKLLIIDEAHNIENNITDFVSVTLDKYIVTYYGLNWIGYNRPIIYVIDWCKTVLLPKLEQVKTSLDIKIKGIDKNTLLSSGEGKALLKQFDDVDRYICQLHRCVKRFVPNEWVMSNVEEENKIILKPLFASKFAYEQLFRTADKILLMSGTILDKNTYCRNVGVTPSEADFISLPSPFKVDNRRIFVIKSGAMTYKEIDKSLPNVTRAIKQLVEKEHANQKGIIHSGSYKIANYINKNFKNNRILSHDSSNRMEMYNIHRSSPKPTVLLSPSLTEGIDLVDELSRFQIIVKVPYPYLGDNYVKEKMERVEGWYAWETAKTIIQAYGRSIRNEDDYSTTYILDSNFEYFYNKNKHLFPKWFKDALCFI